MGHPGPPEPDGLTDKEQGDSPGRSLTVDDQDLVESAGDAVGSAKTVVLPRIAVGAQAAQSGIEIAETFWAPTTQITFPAPAAYGPSWLPVKEPATA